MAYEKTVWVNGQAPALDADHLNKMEQGIADAVSVTPQTLSDAQKTQARGNIGAAPSGYGAYGETLVEPTASGATTEEQQNAEIDELYSKLSNNSSMQILVSPITDLNGGGLGFGVGSLYKRDSSYGGLDVSIYGYRFLRKAKIAGIWQPWEWVNPPMNGDKYTMYRMIDRYKAQPVYKGILGDFEVWKPDSAVWPHGTEWGSAGKAMSYRVEAGETKNITFIDDQTFFVSWSDNVRQGLVVVQTSSTEVLAITNVVAPQNWKIEIGTGLSVNVTELGGQWAGYLSVFMI